MKIVDGRSQYPSSFGGDGWQSIHADAVQIHPIQHARTRDVDDLGEDGRPLTLRLTRAGFGSRRERVPTLRPRAGGLRADLPSFGSSGTWFGASPLVVKTMRSIKPAIPTVR